MCFRISAYFSALLVSLTISAVCARAAEVVVAVAANFTAPAKEIAGLFEKNSGHKAVLSFGATGQFYTQITQGAPFEVFLAADRAHPQRTLDEGLAVPGTAFTYATGRLVLYSKEKDRVQGEATLTAGAFEKLAIANPATAPYGIAAVEVMNKLGLYDVLKPKIVQGNNISQAHQFVETGNAEIGFVAYSQVVASSEGSRWLVPDGYHSPIAQDAVLLKKGADKTAATAFLAFLKNPEALEVIRKFGYGTKD